MANEDFSRRPIQRRDDRTGLYALLGAAALILIGVMVYASSDRTADVNQPQTQTEAPATNSNQ